MNGNGQGAPTPTLGQVLNISEEHRLGTTSSSPFTGSPTFDEAPFHLDVGRSANVGSYVVVGRADEECFHYGRVIDGTEENTDADPIKLQQKAAYGFGSERPVRPGERSPHLTRVMKVEILGEILDVEGDGRLAVGEPSRLPHTGMPVYAVPAPLIPQLLGTPDDAADGFHIGHVQSGNEEVPLRLLLEALARHLLVSGKSGSGKSYFAGVIVEEAVEKEIPIVSFDVLGDLVRATRYHQGINLTAGRQVRVPYSIIGLSEFLSFVPNLTTQQREIVALAYQTIHGEALNTLNQDGNVSLPLGRLLDEINDVATRAGQAAVGGRAISRIRAAIVGNPLIDTDMGEWVGMLAQRPVVNIFVGHLDQHLRNLIVGPATRMLQVMRVRDRVPPFMLVLDEAHFFLPAGGGGTASTGVIREFIRTARHHAIGVVVITQSPSSLDRQILLLCNTKITFALERDDLRVVSGTLSDLPEAVIARIPKMPKGRAVVSSGADMMRHAAVVHIRERRSPEGAPTPNLAAAARRWREEAARRDAGGATNS